MKTARILSSLVFALALVVLFTSKSAMAAGSLTQLTGAKDKLDDSRPSVATVHTFTWTTGGAAAGFDLHTVRFQFCKEPYGNDGTCTSTNAGLNTTTGTGTLTSAGGTSVDDTNYTVSTDATSVWFQHSGSSGDTISSSNSIFTAQLGNITNPSLLDCTPMANGSSTTCYVRIYMCTYDTSANQTKTNCTPTVGTSHVVYAQTIVSFTVITDITVSARVDPYFTFKVEGVAATTALTNAGNAITATVTSDYYTLPFGHLTPSSGAVGGANDHTKYAAHKLTVTMNTTSGYTVSVKMRSPMTGTYTANNIDPFTANAADWTVPQTWEIPTSTTPNSDTGWIGANTSDATVWSQGAGNSLGKFAPVDGNENIFMKELSSDDGTNPTTLTYALAVDVNQPSDTYTGYLVYNCLPTY